MDKYIPELIKRLYAQIPHIKEINYYCETFCEKGNLCSTCLLLKEAASTIQMLRAQEDLTRELNNGK